MALAFLPPIGTSGIYTLASPFNSKLQLNTSYRCEANRRFSDFLEVGIDPYEQYYEPEGLTRERYELDVANNVVITTLVSGSNHFVYVPSSFIASLPDINGVAYSVLILGLELGALPKYLDLTGLKSTLAQLCEATVGVLPTVREAIVSATEQISQSDHDTIEHARQIKITNSDTDRAKLLRLQAQYDTLNGQYQQLEAYVKQNLPPP